jgi:hypothetical protein
MVEVEIKGVNLGRSGIGEIDRVEEFGLPVLIANVLILKSLPQAYFVREWEMVHAQNRERRWLGN